MSHQEAVNHKSQEEYGWVQQFFELEIKQARQCIAEEAEQSGNSSLECKPNVENKVIKRWIRVLSMSYKYESSTQC